MTADTRKTIRPPRSIRRTLAACLRALIRSQIVAPAPPEAPPAPPSPVKKGCPGRYTAESLDAPWPPCVGFRTVTAPDGLRYCQRRPNTFFPRCIALIQMEPAQ